MRQGYVIGGYPIPDPADEIRELERRSREESGPVKVYQAVEWFERSLASKNQAWVAIERTGIRLSRAAYRALGEPRAVQFGWDNLRNGLIVAPVEPGDRRAFAISARSASIGGASLATRISQHIPYGRYEAVPDGQKRLFVKAPVEEKRR